MREHDTPLVVQLRCPLGDPVCRAGFLALARCAAAWAPSVREGRPLRASALKQVPVQVPKTGKCCHGCGGVVLTASWTTQCADLSELLGDLGPCTLLWLVARLGSRPCIFLLLACLGFCTRRLALCVTCQGAMSIQAQVPPLCPAERFGLSSCPQWHVIELGIVGVPRRRLSSAALSFACASAPRVAFAAAFFVLL